MSSTSPPSSSHHIDVTIQDVFEAEQRIRPFVLKTPLLSKTALTNMGGWSKGLYFKCEALQRTGSFKIRGCTNAVRKALEEQKHNPKTNDEPTVFVCHSSGNAAQALAKAAAMNGQKSHIVVPRTAPAAKVAAMKEYGATVTFCEPNLKAREVGVKHLLDVEYKNKKAVMVHPYDNPLVIAGQGTCGLEIAEQFPIALQEKNQRDRFLLSSTSSTTTTTVPVIISPVGGGGLTSGVALALRFKFPNAIIIGAEPKNVDDASRSFQSGKIEPNSAPATPSFAAPPGQPTIADGLMTTLSPRTLSLLRENLDGIVTVTEEEIAEATKEIYQRLKIVIEPSAGVPAAVALYKRDEIVRRFAHKVSGGEKSLNAAVCILCGGNVDLKILAKL